MTLEENMGRDWYQMLSPFIKSDTFKQLATFMHNEYNTKTIYPKRNDVFKAFRLSPFHNTRVVWLGKQPYSTGESLGLSYGVNPATHRVPPSLDMVLSELESSYYQRLLLDFDYTFESWAKQGVLMLNTALTVIKNKPDSHLDLWKPFMEEVFKLLNEQHTGLIFVLLGKKAQSYKHLIGKNHHIVEAPHPDTESRYKEISFLGSGIFKKVDELLLGINGQNNLIKWNETI